MVILTKLAGVASMAFGVLLCTPISIQGWRHFYRQSALGGVSIGSLSFTGNQAWAVLAGCGLLGAILILLGVYALLSSRSDG